MEKLEEHDFNSHKQAYQLLLDEDSDRTSEDFHHQDSPVFVRLRKRLIAEILFASLFVIFIILLVTQRRKIPYSPANEAVSYELHKLWDGERSDFKGPPSDIINKAWFDLLEPVNIRAYKHEYEKANAPLKDAVQLVDGDYVALLSVYHDLHCLNSIRRSLYPEFYWVNATDSEVEIERHHLAHCVESIRRTIMCKADVSMYSTYWTDDIHTIPNKQLRSEASTLCVNWDRIESWAKQRLLPRGKFKLKPGPFERFSASK